MKIEIKTIFGKVIYTYEKENATIKQALENAIKERVNLVFADLSLADLGSANLSSANLSSANLGSANLRSANLSLADLGSANLSSANLSSTNLSSANLSSAIKIPINCKWDHGITNENLIHIGCTKFSIEDWDIFFESNEELSTKRGTAEFKQIEAVYLSYKAYLTHLKS